MLVIAMLSSLLILMVLQPVAAALLVVFWRGDELRSSRMIALASSCVSLACAIALAASFDPSEPGIQMDQLANWAWLPGVGIRFHLGLDGISLWLVVLTALLSVTCVLVSWESVREGVRGYYSLLLLLETGMLGVFAAMDIILFYIFFEFTLIPLFFLIGVWGGVERRLAALKFFIYTLAGSVLTFVGLIYIVAAYYQQSGVLTFSIPQLTSELALSTTVQWWLFLALMAGFAIKVPLFPLHTWLPLAHVEAPTAGSVLLAGVLLKVGGYGFLRFSLPLLPDASNQFLGVIAVLSIAGIVYGALVALAQDDIKRLIAYSSVSHLGFCMLGLFALSEVGISGGLLQMVNHGLATGALFAMVGMLYDRYHTRRIDSLGGLARKLPVLTFFFVFITLASIGLPGLNGFVGEFLVLVAAFQLYKPYAVVAALGIILGAFYMLWLVERVFFGELKEPLEAGTPVKDLGRREIAALAPIAVLCLWIGVYPNFFLRRMEPTVQTVAQRLADDAPVSVQVRRGSADRNHGRTEGLPRSDVIWESSGDLGSAVVASRRAGRDRATRSPDDAPAVVSAANSAEPSGHSPPRAKPEGVSLPRRTHHQTKPNGILSSRAEHAHLSVPVGGASR